MLCAVRPDECCSASLSFVTRSPPSGVSPRWTAFVVGRPTIPTAHVCPANATRVPPRARAIPSLTNAPPVSSVKGLGAIGRLASDICQYPRWAVVRFLIAPVEPQTVAPLSLFVEYRPQVPDLIHVAEW